MAKLYLLYALYDAQLIWLIFVAVFNTLLSLFYYVRVVRAMFLETSDEPSIAAPVVGQAVVAICSVVILLTGTFYAGRLKEFADARSRASTPWSSRRRPVP